MHKAQVTVCVRVPDRSGDRHELMRQVSTMTGELLELRDWLKGLGVTHDRVRLHADLTILAKLACALSRARAVPLAA